ncbi:GNAT family N-acetyltransferase [Streptomyces sp. GESEQ-35]|uniref:GNAT family N-acetyltransferase n=1 Tax=Streptomyces sp. GESEQ-35 TaxID=2812657 RepID=UPI001B33F94E|nr:GNAT family N-acetyltransferase [Streptomyces sp. GESEQ-35]
MEFSVVRPRELTDADLDAWRTFHGADPALNHPFLAPEFTLLVGDVRPAARVAVVYDDARRPVGFFPFERRALGLGKPIGSGVSDFQGLVHAPGVAWDPVELLRACGLHLWQFDHLAAGQDPFVTGSAGAVRRAASPVIGLEDGYDAYLARLRRRSPRFLRSLGTKERRLSRDAGDVRFVFDESAPQVLETLMRWKSAQYRARGRVDQFARPWVVALLRELRRTRSAGCTGTLSVLYAGGRPVACHFGPRSGRVLSCWFPAYDTDFAACSPGILLHLKIVEAAAAQGLSLYDLGKGAERYKDSLKTGELPLFEGWVSCGSAPAALRRLQADAAHGARRAVAGSPVLRGAALRMLRVAGQLTEMSRRMAHSSTTPVSP